MQKIDFLNILDGEFSNLTYLNLVSPDLSDVKIEVQPFQVRKIIISYLNGKINSLNLNRWAEFLCFRDEYVSKNWENEKSADFYEDMWYVVQKLSTPEIDGEITPETVRQYLKELDKYFENQKLQND